MDNNSFIKVCLVWVRKWKIRLRILFKKIMIRETQKHRLIIKPSYLTNVIIYLEYFLLVFFLETNSNSRNICLNII